MRWPADHPWQLVYGPTLWAIWFVLVYGGLSVACAVLPPASAGVRLGWINGCLLLLTLAVTLLLVRAAVACRRAAARIPPGAPHARRRFMASSAAMLHAISAASTVFVGLPLLVLSPCV